MMELMVSVGLTAILMVGVATFFSSTFRNMFIAREKVTNTQSQFVVNTILGGKFVNVESLDTNNSCSGECVVLRNDMRSGDLPFTYIGTKTIDDADYVVFKDFFVFNGKYGSLSSQAAENIENPGGLTELDGTYYVTSPLEDKIYSCDEDDGYLIDCDSLEIEGLDHPMDITDNGTNTLYVTDAGNDRVVIIEDPFNTEPVTLASDLNYPTGIEYYLAPISGKKYLFVSDTYNHVVKKVDIAAETAEIVVGDGDDEVCDFDDRDHTALYCKLNFPTGLMIYDGELYIADMGNGRVLKVSDPGPPANEEYFERISFTFDDDVAVGKIEFTAFDDETYEASSMIDPGSLNGSYSKITHELTLNSIFSTYDGPCTWDNTGSVLWTEEDPSPYIDTNDLIAIENGSSGNAVIYEATSVPSDDSLVCLLGPPGDKVAYRAYIIPLDQNLLNVSNNKPVFRAGKSGNKETIDLTFPDISSFDETGFQAIDIKVFDFDQITSVETHQHFVRVGDDELGTPEDTILVYEDVFPTGHFLTGLGWDAELEVSDTPQYSPDFSSSGYDYVSDFDVQNFTFDTLNSDTILELNFEANLGKDMEGVDIWEPYTLNADL